MASTTFPFTTAGNYTASTAAKIEVTGGLGTLKDMQSQVEFVANYASSVNANYVSGGTGVPAITGSVALSGGKLNFPTGGSQYADYTVTSNAATAAQVGTVRFRLTPSYSGSPGSLTQIFCWVEANNTNDGRLNLYHETGGNLVIYAQDQNQAGILAGVSLGAWSPTAGTEYEFSLNYDFDSGAQRLFINGVQQGSTQTGTGTRGPVNLFRIGADAVRAGNANFLIDDLVIYDTVQHTANYTPGYDAPVTQYTTTSPSLLTNNTILGRPLTFSVTVSETGSDTVTYAFRYGGQDYYWNGSAWVTSSGSGQSNPASDLTEAVMRQLNPGANQLAVRVYLTSSSGTTTPTIDSMTITYDARDVAATEPNLVYIEGYIYGAAAPIANQAVEIRAKDGYQSAEVFVVREWFTIGTTDSNGYFNGYVFASASTGDYELRIGTNRYTTTIPDSGSVTLSGLSLTRITL